MVRALLVDDDPLVCRALQLLLDGDPSIAVGGSVHDDDEVVDAVHRYLASAQAKLGSRNRVQVGVIAAHAGLVDPSASP